MTKWRFFQIPDRHGLYDIRLFVFLLLAHFSLLPAIARLAGNTPLDADLQTVHQLILDSKPNQALAALDALPPEATSSPGRKAQIFWLRADALHYLTRIQEANEAVQQALRWVDRVHQPWLYHQALLTQAAILDNNDQPQEALKAANIALVWAENRGDMVLLNTALVVRGLIYNTLMDYVSALADLQRAYEITGQSGQQGMARGEIAGFIALVYEYRHEPKLAMPYFQEAVDYYRQQNNDMELSIALYGLGKAHKAIGNRQQAADLLRESIARAKKVNDEQGVAYALVELAHMDSRDKRYDAALAQYREALAIFEKSGNPFKLSDINSAMALIAIKQGRLASARQLLDKATGYLKPETSPVQYNNLQFIRAELLARQGQPAAAYALLKKASQDRQRFVSEESTRQLHQMQVRFQLRDKQRENALLQEKARVAEHRNRVKNISLASSLAVGGILLAWGLRSRQQRRRMERLATTDHLTGLPNRRVVMDTARQWKDMVDDRPVALALLDFDDFKAINDTWGHAVGDAVLREFGQRAGRLLAQEYPVGILGRVGGEEFLLLLPGQRIEQAKKLLGQLAQVAKGISDDIGQPALRLTLSVGLSRIQPGGDIETDYARIDQALYQAKAQGKDRVVVAVGQDRNSGRRNPDAPETLAIFE